jgi:hypothetical protein
MSGMSPLSDHAVGRAPTLARNPDGRLEVFVIDPNGHLGHAWQVQPNSSWSAWDVLSTTGFSGGPAAEMNVDGRLEVLTSTPGLALWDDAQAQPNAGWSGFRPLVSGVGV